jgi:SPP1 gp7 family putative phage head morphogenesis protein
VDAAFAALPKARARKAGAPTLADFHRQTDAIVAHYAPLIAAALAGLWSEATIAKAWDAAQKASKAVADPPAGPPVPDAAAGPVEQVLSDEQMAAGAQGLRTLLAEMYGDAALQGAHEAAHAAGATIVSSLQGVTEQLPGSYWSTWEPGQWSAAAAQVADGRLKDVLDQADITIRGLTDSAIRDMGNAIADGLAAGDSFQTTAKVVQEVVCSPARAALIANTEMARAMTAAAVDEYQASGIERVDWLAEDSACAECASNADGNPHDLADAPTPPQHPMCRCCLSPALS